MSVIPEPPLFLLRDEFGPVPEVARLREAGGVARVPGMFGQEVWMVTGFAELREVMSHPEWYSNALVPPLHPPGAPPPTDEERRVMKEGNLLGLDPPEHTRLRRMLTPEFTARRLSRLEPRIAEIVEEHLDAMERGGPPADLVAEFALPIPSLVICELLGVPYADRADFQRNARGMLDMKLPPAERMAASMAGRAYIGDLIARKRHEPDDGLLSALLQSHGDELTETELISIGVLLLLAGHETTANMLSLGTYALLRHPDQLKLLRAEPGLVEPAVEELLRWLSVVHTGTFKLTTTEVRLGGHTIGPGELVVCCIPAANRDPAFLDHPETLDITRGAVGHAAFGHGIHHCLGAPLARMELRIALPALLGRFPNLRVAGDPVYRQLSVVYGLDHLPVAW